MFPDNAMTNIEDCTRTHTKLCRNAGVTDATGDLLAYSLNRVWRQSGIMVCSSESTAYIHSTSLTSHIVQILGLGSKEQVIGANTDGVITAMKNIQCSVKRTICKFIRHSMSFVCATFDRESTVSCPGKATGPQPTFIGLLHLFPESIFNRTCSVRAIACGAAIQTFALTKRSDPDSKRCSAMDTNVLNGRLSCATIGGHQSYSFGVMLTAVSAARGLSCASIIPRTGLSDALNHA